MSTIPNPTENRLPNDQVRAAFVRSGKSATEVARLCGWYRNHRYGEQGDSTKVHRLLGMLESVTRKGDKKYRRFQTTISEADAVAILDAINVAPWEVGL